MRKLLAVVVVALLGAPVMGQFGGFGLQDAKALLAMPTVQDELKLTDAQKKELKAATEELQKGIKAAIEDKDFAAMPKLQEDHLKVVVKVLDKLDDKQKARMAELEFQAGTKGKAKNPRVFGNATIQKALKLSDKQKGTIKTALSEMEKDVKEIDDDAKDDIAKRFQAFGQKNKLYGKTYETIVEALTEDQKKSFSEVGGKAFEFPTFKFGKDKKEEKKKDD